MGPNPPQHRGSALAGRRQHIRRAFRPLLEHLETRVVPSSFISSLSPNTAVEGSGPFTLRVIGSGFVGGDTVHWNGINLVPFFSSSSQLDVTVPSSLVSEESTPHGGPILITVFNSSGTQDSINAQLFNITEAPLSAAGVSTIRGVTGQSLTALVATFTDSGGPEQLSDYSASINWGDGSSPSAGSIGSGRPNSLFTVTGSHTYATIGTFSISVTIFHETASPVTVTDTANISRTIIGIGPTITSLSPNTAVEGSAGFTLIVNGFNFVPGATVQWNSTTTGTTSLATTFISSSQLQAIVPSSLLTEESNTVHGLQSVTVSQNGLTSNALSFTITEAPIFGTGGFAISGVAGQSLTATVATFTNGGGSENPFDPNDYSASISWGDSTSSSGAISLSNGVFTVTGTHSYATGGTFNISVTINHETASPVTVFDTATIIPITIGITPTISSLSPNTVVEGSGSFTLFVFGSNFVPGATVKWNSTITGTTILATKFDSSSQLQATVPASLLTEESNSIHGTQTVTVSQNGLTSNAVPFTITEAPIFGTGGFFISGFAGHSLTATVATFTDSGGPQNPNDPGDYSATINWGDSTSSSGTISLSSNVFRVTGTHTYAGTGTFTVSVTINHETASPVTVFDTASISGAILSATGGFTFNAVESQPLTNITVATGSGTARTATIDWGDTTSSAGTIISTGNGGFIVTGSHSYLELPGQGDLENEQDAVDVYTITVTISNSTSVTVTDTANVSEEVNILSATGMGTISAVQGQALNNVAVATFTASEPKMSQFSATIAWGDGNSSTGTITQGANGRFIVSGSNMYQALGKFLINVTIKDADGSKATATSTATVADAPLAATGLAINASQGSTFSGVVATFTDADSNPNLNDLSATITWGDGNSSTGTITQNADGSFNVSGSNTYQATGTFTITVTINDAGGSTVMATSTANVVLADLPLSGTGMDITATQFMGQDQIVAQFTDPDPNAQVGDYQAVINWGDGTQVDTGTVTEPGGPGTPFFVDFTHAYNDAGTFTIHVTITDDGGASVDLFSTATVVSPSAPHGPGSGSRGPGQASILQADVLLLGNDLQLGTNAMQGSAGQLIQGGAATSPSAASAAALAQASASVQSGRPKPGNDTYWQILSHLRGDQITDPNGWAAYELALALEGTAR